MNRPKVNDEMIAEAARRTADACTSIPADRRAELANSIAAQKYRGWPDGFRMGKDLERDGWDVDAHLVEELDCYGSHLDRVHRDACLKWAIESNIQPPYPIGTRTTKGEITGIYEYGAASYLIKPYGQDDAASNHRRIIVTFEDVVLESAVAA